MGHILVIDDDPDIRDLVSVYLEGAGHSVTHAENGQAGIDLAQEYRPDLLVLDINMPIMDGTRVMQILRGAPETAKLPVIALSAMTASDMRDDMYQLGCDAYVVKPIDFGVLMDKVDKLISS